MKHVQVHIVSEHRLLRFSGLEAPRQPPERPKQIPEIQNLQQVEASARDRVKSAETEIGRQARAVEKTNQLANKLGALAIAVAQRFLKPVQDLFKDPATAKKNPRTKEAPERSVLPGDIEELILGLRKFEATDSNDLPPIGNSLENIHEASRNMTQEQRELLTQSINSRLQSAGLGWHARNLNGEVGIYRPNVD